MIFAWLRRRRRRKLLETPFPEAWSKWLEALPVWEQLDDDERARLRDTARVIVVEKRWEGCGGFEITDEVRMTIAAQAALLLIGIEHEYYRRVRTILVYPSTFVIPDRHSGGGVQGTKSDTPVLGLAQYRGPVVLAWDSAQHGGANFRDGRNVVLHEFAHKLDMLDGWADGTPPLRDQTLFEDWVRVLSEEYEDLCEDARKGRRTVLDKYGATHPAEFFAVATESFFEKPRTLERKQKELYDVLKSYYGQDPAARVRRNLG